MSQLFPSREEESSMWSRLETQRTQREAAMRQVTPQGAVALTTMHRAYPQLATGTKVSLARNGVSPDDPIMAAVAQADQSVKRKKGFGWHSIGDAVSAGFHNTIGKGLELAGGVISPVGEAIGSAARPVVRTGLMALAAPLEEAQGLLRNVASAGPGKTGEVGAGALGGAAAGAGIGAALGSVVPILGNVVGAGSGAIVGGIVGAAAGLLGPEVEGKAQWASQSQLGMAATHLAQGEKVQAGSGWFANAETELGKEQKERALKAAGIKNKKNEIIQGWTIGRSVANVITEPGTTPYNLMSGLIDAGAAVKLDPTGAALKNKAFSPTLRALKKEGLIDGARKTILAEKSLDLLDHSGFGAKLKEVVAAEGNTYRIGRLFNGELDHNPAALAALADATTPEEAGNILRPLLGADVASVPKTQLGTRRTARLLHNVPEDKALKSRQTVEIAHRIEWDDPKGAIAAIDSWMAIGKVDEATRLKLNDEFIRALSGPITGRLPALDSVARAVSASAVGHGADEQTARQLGTLFKKSIEDARQFTAGTIVDDGLLPGMVVNGDAMGLKSPFLINEFLNHGVDLPNMRELSDTVRLVKAFNHPLAKVPVELADKAMFRWRQMAVLRPATTMRVAADEQARMATAGYRGLTHPGQLISRIIADRKGNVVPDITGVPLFDAEVMQGALNRTRGSEVLQTAGVSMADRARISVKDGPEIFKAGWRDHELSRLHTDPLGRQLARLRRTGNSAALEDEVPELAGFLGDPARVAGGMATEELERMAATATLPNMTTAEDVLADVAAVVPERGAPGVSKVTLAAEDAPSGSPAEIFVHRTDDGRVVGALAVELDEAGRPVSLYVGVDPGHQRQGIATNLYQAAERAGLDVEAASGAGGLTPEGAAFALGRRSKAAGVDPAVKTAVADATGRGPNYQSVDDLKDSFWEGPLSRLRKDLQAMDEEAPVLATREASDAYVDQLNQWIDEFTMNDDRLLEYVHRGPKAGEKAFAAMDEMIEAGNHPPLVVGDRTLRHGAERKQVLDRMVDSLFDTFHAKPTNALARSRVAMQDYYRNVERMLPALDDAEKAQIIRQARQAKMDPDTIARLEAKAKVAWTGEKMSLEHVDQIAKIQAVENTKKLLYDVTTKGKWADATRLIFPFAEPWKESLTVWGTLLKENPAAVRRLDQTVQGARGSGFFQKDPQTGEEMFVYPGSAFISKMIVGAPVPLRGSAAGLNLFASNPIMPGMGPTMQVAANALLPDKPDFDWIRNTVSPYGRTDTSEGFVESFLPSWFQKIRQGMTSGEGDRLFNNTVYDMARYLVSTGDYSIETPEAQEETTQAAISMAKRMYFLRAGASFTSPSAPSPQMIAEDKDGRVVTQMALMDEYRALQKDPGTKTKVNGHDIEGVGYENATDEFLTRYGEGALLLMQPKTKGGAAPLDDTMDWIRENPDLAKRYDEVYQYFAPHSGEFSQTAYEREIATGERKPLTPKEAMEAANARVASMLMRQARTRTGTKISDGERQWLSAVQSALIDEYPGYNPKSFDAGRVPAAIRQLEDALGNKKLAESKNGEAISLYLAARGKAQESAKALGLSGFEKAKKARGIRDWLRNVAAAITEDTPEFSTVWDQLLSHELASDLDETLSA